MGSKTAFGQKKVRRFILFGGRYSDPNYLELLPVLCKDQMQAEQKFVDSDEHTVAFPIDRVLNLKWFMCKTW